MPVSPATALPQPPRAPAARIGLPAKQSFAPYRLRRHADYGLVYAASRKYFSPSLAFFFRVRQPNEHAAPAAGPRLGLTCPRALGKAVVRNRIKRRMREGLRLELLPLLGPGVPPVDLVLHPKALVAHMPFAELVAELAALLERVAAMAPSGPEPPRPRTGAGGKGSAGGKGRPRR